jgi:actin-related protein 5
VVTELLFESYNVPSVAYGIDALFSYHANTPDPNSGGLIVSSSYENTYVLPYAPGNTLFELVKRITFGGSNASSYFLSLLQAKYPAFPVKVTFNQAESMLHEHGYLSMDYLDELRGYDDPETREERDLIVQFPYSLAPERAEKTDEEKARMEEKKKEQGKRLQEQAARKKQEKIDHMEAYIGELKAILELKETDPKEYSARLKYQNLRNESALAAALAEVEADLHKTRTGSGRHKKKTLEDYENEVAPPTDMLEFPDDTLTPEQLREKRRQRTMKANWDARERARKERDLAAKLKQEKIQREIDKRTNDFAGWLEEKHKRRQELVERQLSRKKLRAQLQDRRSQASKAKMRTVAQLAKDDEGPVGRRGKAKGALFLLRLLLHSRQRTVIPDDGFGQDDSDWNVYHEISKDTPEDEEAELAELGHLDELLNQYDPGFKPDDMDEDEKAMRQSIVYRLAHGAAAELGTFPPDKKVVAAKANQIHLNVERIRVSEVLFQPSIVGLDQAGIVEIISQILRGLDPAAQDMLMRNVLITGTHTLYPNLVERLEQELRSIRPVGSPLVVRRAVDPRLDAWRGAAMWAASSGAEGLKKASLTRKEYLEAGEDYLKEFAYSNRH